MRNLLAASVVAVALCFAGTALADTGPTVHQIYQAASSGHLDQAQQMMDQVLRDHPDSAKAHYVQSELYAREGKLPLARAELDRAEQLSPGLPKEDPRSVVELKSQLGLMRRGYPIGAARESTPRLNFPWGTVLILVLVIGAFWMLFRRRTTYAQYPPGNVPTAGPGGYGPGGYGPGGAVAGGGIGSTVAGGLAGGLAAGAGLVAGEALAHRFLEGGQPSAPPLPAEDDGANKDMGGADFGVNDPGSWDDGGSWSDGSGGGGDAGGGGDDWT
jgi:uncharacterized protein